MSTRALQAKILCDKETLEHLWRTHRVFNERVPKLLSILLRMRRGDVGNTDELRGLYRLIARFILSCSARDAYYLLHSISFPGWKPNTALNMKVTVETPSGSVEISGDRWAPQAAELNAAGHWV
jgi:hypothetical protein